MSFRKKLKLLNMSLYNRNTGYIVLLVFFHIFFIHLINFKFIHKFP